MAYFGNEPAKVAVKVGSGVITATELADDSITTADIIDDAITPNQLDDDGTGFQVGTLGVGAAVSGGHTLVVSGSTSLGGVAKISEAGSGNVLLETTQSSKYLQLKSNEGIYFSTSGANHNYIDSSINLHTQDIHSKDIYLDQPRSNWRTIQYRDTDNSNAIQAYVSAYNTSASDGFLRLNAIESLQFRTGDTERLKLTSSEATFAGTIKSQPAEGTDATLHLDASGNGNAQVWIDAGTSTRHPELSFRHDGSNYWTVKSDPDRSNDFCLRDDQNSAAIQLRIAQSTGDATFAGNITMPDSLIHTGDTDTMVRFGTDEVHLRTGGGAGLYVRNSEVEVYRVTTKLSNANAQLWVGEGDGASDIYMSKGDTGDEVRFSKNAAGNLDILTNGGVIHLNVDGKCGIGTGSPSEQLHISTTGASTALQIHSGTASSTTGVSQIYFSSKDQYGGNTHQSYIKSTIDGSSSVSTTKMIFQNRNSSGSVVDVLTLYSPNATFKGTVNIRKDSGDGDLYLYNADASQGLRIDQNSIRTTTNNGLSIFPNDTSSKGIEMHNDAAKIIMGGSSHTLSAHFAPSANDTYNLGHDGTHWATMWVEKIGMGITDSPQTSLQVSANSAGGASAITSFDVGMGVEFSSTEDYYAGIALVDSGVRSENRGFIGFKGGGSGGQGYSGIAFGTTDSSSNSTVERMSIRPNGDIYTTGVYGAGIQNDTYRDMLVRDDGLLGSNTSSRRYKEDIMNIEFHLIYNFHFQYNF